MGPAPSLSTFPDFLTSGSQWRGWEETQEEGDGFPPHSLSLSPPSVPMRTSRLLSWSLQSSRSSREMAEGQSNVPDGIWVHFCHESVGDLGKSGL